MKDNPNAAGQFPSPITPPRQGEVATGRGATIDNLLMNQPEQEAISQFQLPIGTHLTDDDGNVIQPIGITEDGTPIYDFIQTD
ncbi:MAG: hypothetical protein GX811_03130 [Lentisphaerae bacterium]|nr:hypothetical protein [Lentisphaerota bacterium]